MTQNLWVAAKADLRGKFIAIQSYLNKEEKSQISNLGTSLVVQWLRIHLSMQGTWV